MIPAIIVATLVVGMTVSVVVLVLDRRAGVER